MTGRRTTGAALSRQVERSLGIAAVAVVGPVTRDNTCPFTIVPSVSSAALKKQIYSADRWNEAELKFYAFHYATGWPTVERIAQALELECDLQGWRTVKRKWFRCDEFSLLLTINRVVAPHGPHVFGEVEKDRRVQVALEREIAKALG